MRRVALVGATGGIGEALAHEFARRGWRVAVVARDEKRALQLVGALPMVPQSGGGGRTSPRSHHLATVLDVRNLDAVPGVLEEAAEAMGGLELLVYCAGLRDEGRPGETMEVNASAGIVACEWAAGRFLDRGAGHVAAIGSVAGDRGRRKMPVYAASKSALHVYLEGLRARVRPHGIRVTTVKPGWVRTRMLGKVPPFPPAIAPARAAYLIARALERGRDVVYVPWWWELISLTLRVLPRSLHERLRV